jgi:hypothetical protein
VTLDFQGPYYCGVNEVEQVADLEPEVTDTYTTTWNPIFALLILNGMSAEPLPVAVPVLVVLVE